MIRRVVPFGVLAMALVGCGSSASDLPDDPDALTLISIDGTVEVDPSQPGPSPGLYGRPVLGRVEITDPSQRRQVMSEVKAAVQKSATQAKCFFPRHVLRVTSGGSEIDVVICFQCQNYEVCRVGERGGGRLRPIAKDAQPTLDKILTDAGVKLAPLG